MNKFYLQQQIKETGKAYLYFILFGAHYAYLNKWGKQLLFWVTAGGFGLWAIFELFRIKSKVEKHNFLIYQQIEEIEKKDKAENLAMIVAAKN